MSTSRTTGGSIRTLTLNLGFRYEYVSAPREQEDRIDYGFGADNDNYEPRLGAAWTLPPAQGWLAGADRQRVRRLRRCAAATASITAGSSSRCSRRTARALRTNPPNALTRTITTPPGILNVSDPTLGFVFVPGPQTARHTITIADPNLEMPYTHQWSLSYERKLPFDSSLRVTYNGNHVIGHAEVLARQPAAVAAERSGHRRQSSEQRAGGRVPRSARQSRSIASRPIVQCAGTGSARHRGRPRPVPEAVPIADNEISLRVPRTNERRPDPRYTSNLIVSNDAESWYDGIQIEWVKRLQQGPAVHRRATRAASRRTRRPRRRSSAPATRTSTDPTRASRAATRASTRRIASASTAATCCRSGATGRTCSACSLGGWQVSGVVRLASGTPFTVTQTGIDLDFDGFAEGRPDPRRPVGARRVRRQPRDRARRSCRRRRSGATRSATASTRSCRATRSSATASTTSTSGLYKNFTLRGGQALSLRIEVYNVFNTVQYGFPATDATATTFGQITVNHATYIPRTIQLAIQVSVLRSGFFSTGQKEY